MLLVPLAQLVALVAGLAFLRSPQFTLLPAARQATLGAGLALAMTTFVFAVSEPALLFSDFRKAYYAAGKAVLEAPGLLAPVIDNVHGFVNLPVTAYLFAPFGALQLRVAAVAFLLLGVAMIGLAWALLVREADLTSSRQWALLLLFAANGPLLNSLREGNTSHMVLLGLVAGLIFLQRRRDVAAGAVLGLCALIKLPLLIFGAYFLLRRNVKAVAGFSGVIAGSALLSITIFGWDLNRSWFELCVLQFSRNPIGAFNVQSFPGFLLRLEAGAELLRDWSAVDVTSYEKFAGRLSAILLGLVAIAVCARGPNMTSHAERREWLALEYALVVGLAVVASPMSWSHYYCWLLIPTALFLGAGSTLASTPARRRAGWAAIFLTTPAVYLLSFEHPVLETLYVKLMLSHFLAGGLLWFALLAWAILCCSDVRSATSRMKNAMPPKNR